jgi:hypothetical protein
MGLLFMIAGYFVAGSYDRKGFSRFAGDRFRRLVIPTLIYMVVITPFIEYVELGARPSGFNLAGFISGTGVMWFAAALFIFSLAYAFIRLVAAVPAPVPEERQLKPSLLKVTILILVISVSAFLIRIVQPIGTDVLNIQLCYFGSYIVLFVVGVVAYRHSLFAKITYRSAKRWLVAGIAGGFVVWLVLVIVATKTGTTAALNGGVTWQSAAYSVWESFTAVAMCIGLIGLFKEKFDHPSSLFKTLSDDSFAVYMFHPAILVAAALAFSTVAFIPVAKWLVLCMVCVPLCFAAAHFIFRKTPLLRKVL